MLCEATGIAGKGSSDIIPYNLHLEIRNVQVETVILYVEGGVQKVRIVQEFTRTVSNLREIAQKVQGRITEHFYHPVLTSLNNEE